MPLDALARPRSLHGRDGIEWLLPWGRGAGERLWVIGDGAPIPGRAEVTKFVAETRGPVRREA